MNISVNDFDGHQLSLVAPLVHNSNDKGTAFGGSLYCLAVMSCWSWFYLRCLNTRIEPIGVPNIVVTKASIDYLLPVTDETIIATCRLDDESIWQVLSTTTAQKAMQKFSSMPQSTQAVMLLSKKRLPLLAATDCWELINRP